MHPVVLKEGAPKQRFLQRKDNNIKVTGTFFFHSESKFASRCFEQRCSKAEVPSAKKLQEHFSFSFEANICVLVF